MAAIDRLISKEKGKKWPSISQLQFANSEWKVSWLRRANCDCDFDCDCDCDCNQNNGLFGSTRDDSGNFSHDLT